MLTILQALLSYLGRVPSAIIRGWDRFFFTPADPIVLGFIRIVVGSILFYVHLSCSTVVMDFIGPEAWVDEQVYSELHDLSKHPKFKLRSEPPPSQGEIDEHAMNVRLIKHYGFSIWFLINDPFWIRVTYFAGLVCVGLFTLGFMTRITSILSWVFHISYMHRAMMIWFGMDAMISFMLLYLCVGPCGSVLSVDRLLAKWRKGDRLPPVQPMWSANLALRLIQIHMCIVYFIAGVAKLQGTSWWNGTATWLTMNSPMFNEGLDLSWMTDTRMGEWFWYYICFFSTYMTLAFEITFPFLIWNRYLRPWILFGAFGLHVGIALFMGLGGFGAIMLSGCMAFIPSAGMRWFLDTLTRGKSNPLISNTNSEKVSSNGTDPASAPLRCDVVLVANRHTPEEYRWGVVQIFAQGFENWLSNRTRCISM